MIESLPNLLIVDDNDANLALLEVILGKLQVNLIKASSGLEALNISNGQELALAILDIQMPEMNGFELAVKINEDRGGNIVPIIFVTANHANELDVTQGYVSGAVDYIVKPINIHILLSKVNIFLDLFNHKQTIIREAELLEKNAEELIWVNAALKKSEEKYRSYIDNAPDDVFITDERGMCIEVNNAACINTGYSKDELLKMSIAHLFSYESREIGMAHIKTLIKTGVLKIDIPFKHKNGTKRWWAFEAVKLSEKRFLCFAKDITQRRLAEDKLKESESSLEEAQRIAQIGSFEWDMVSNITKWSKEMFRVFDIDAETFDGHPETVLKIVHPDDVELFRNSMNSNLAKGNSATLEYRVIHRDGSIHNIYAEGRIEFDRGGNPIRNIGTAQDITDRKKVEQELKISEEKYRTMLNASPDGILLIDLKGIITEVSEIGFELFDADKRDDLVGKDFYQFIPPDEANTIKDIFEKTVSEGLVQNAELIIRKKSQSTFQSEISSTLIQAPDGEPLSFMITVRDISQRKKIETKQIHADRMANLGEMASGIAHEINQPLNIISMVMDKILFETDKKETIDIEFLKTKSDKIFDNITRIRNIIDHVRAFSRSDNNYLLTAFDINSSIENAVSMITEQYKHLDINLNTQLDQQIPQIVGNTFKFEQVIVNLLTNAKDAVLERRRKQEDYCDLKVEIKTYQENQFLIVEIIDNGTGIDKEDIHNIMLPFYTTKEEGKGTGLGLSICYQIIKEMHGTIDISSDGVNETKIKLVLDIQKTN